MSGKIFAIFLIFIGTTIGWIVLGSATAVRSTDQDAAMKHSVQMLWGGPERQNAPTIYFERETEVEYPAEEQDKIVKRKRLELVTTPARFKSSDIDVNLSLEHRKKGLQWFPTYVVDYSGTYAVANTTDTAQRLVFQYEFPRDDGVYDNFVLAFNGEPIEDIQPVDGKIRQHIPLKAGESAIVSVGYRSQGMENWWYQFGEDVERINNFALTMTTDFDDINFPDKSMSPTLKVKTEAGWRLQWEYTSLISGIQIGMIMPQKINPGPFVSRVSLFAPVSLFLFFFLMFMITTIREIRMHPMNYFFLAAGFFAFHLLLAYLVDHVEVHLAMAISSVISILLVVTYMRLVVGAKFALIETGLSQFVYLVLFSYAFFLEGYSGLAITICCIITLFVIMQLTGRIDWEARFAELGGGRSVRPLTQPPPPPQPKL